MFYILASYNNEILPNSIHYFAKIDSKFCPKLNKRSTKYKSLAIFQSGEISPNLVTLITVSYYWEVEVTSSLIAFFVIALRHIVKE